MRKVLLAVTVAFISLVLATGCARKQKKIEKQVKSDAAINRTTAEGDIRVLKNEKAHVASRVAEGVTALAPAGIVIGILTGTEGTKLKVAVGDYNKAIDKRIADIKRTCGT